jgi:hypothetical protein
LIARLFPIIWRAPLNATGKRGEAKTLLQATMAKNPKFDGSDDAKQLLTRW